MDKVTIKKCSKCKEKKCFSDFYKNISKKYGISSECRKCSKKIKKEWKNKNREHMYKISREYYLKNKEKCDFQKKKHKENSIKNLNDSYIKTLICQHSKVLISKNIPDKIIEAYRQLILLKRTLRHMRKGN